MLGTRDGRAEKPVSTQRRDRHSVRDKFVQSLRATQRGCEDENLVCDLTSVSLSVCVCLHMFVVGETACAYVSAPVWMPACVCVSTIRCMWVHVSM